MSHSQQEIQNKLKDASEKEVEVVNTIAREWRLRRHYTLQAKMNNLDLPRLSKQNIVSHRQFLKEPEAFLTLCGENNIDHTSIEKSSSLLSEDETLLYRFVIHNLTIRHSTDFRAFEAIKKNNYYLAALDERARTYDDPSNSRTPHSQLRGADTYWVTGVGEHLETRSLRGSSKYIFSINLRTLAHQEPSILKKLWVSPHIGDIFYSSYSEPVLLDDTRFQLAFDNETKTITYYIQRPDSRRLQWTIKTEELIFTGQHVLHGLAYHFILLLRLIGGTYPKHLTETLKSNHDSEEKLAVISLAMTSLMPGWMSIEAKIPVGININKPYAEIIESNRHARDKEGKVYYDWLESENQRSLSLEDRYLISSTLQIRMRTDARDALCDQFKENDPTDISTISKIKNPLDPRVTQLVNVNGYNDKLINDLLDCACYHFGDDISPFQTLLNSGARMFPNCIPYYLPALEKKHLRLANFILEQEKNLKDIDKKNNLIYGLIRYWGNLLTYEEVSSEDEKSFYELLKKLISLDCRINVRVSPYNGSEIQDGENSISISPLDITITTNNIAATRLLLESGGEIRLTHWWQYFQGKSYYINYIKFFRTKELSDTEEEVMLLTQDMHDLLKKYIPFPERQEDIPQSIKSNDIWQHLENEMDYHVVVVIVTGLIDGKTQGVLLGKKDSSQEGELMFPGGALNKNESVIAAGLRELYEETCIDLRADVENGVLTPKILSTEILDVHGEEASSPMKISIVHLDVTEQLRTLFPYAQSDFKSVCIVPINKIHSLDPLLNFYRGSPIRPSNVYLLTQITQNLPLESQTLRLLLCHELFPVKTNSPILRLSEIYIGKRKDKIIYNGFFKIHLKNSLYKYSTAFKHIGKSYLQDPNALITLGRYDINFILLAIHLYPYLLKENNVIKQILCLSQNKDLMIHLYNLGADYSSLPNQDKKEIVALYIDRENFELFEIFCIFHRFSDIKTYREYLSEAFEYALQVNKLSFAKKLKCWIDNPSLPTVDNSANKELASVDTILKLSERFQTLLRCVEDYFEIKYKSDSIGDETKKITLEELQPMKDSPQELPRNNFN